MKRVSVIILLAAFMLINLKLAAQPSIGGFNVYYGSLHNHSNISDGTGAPDYAYNYAKNTGHLDFFSLSDHSNQISSAEWAAMKAAADKYYEPGNFTTFYGFEWTESVQGHVTVFNSANFVSTTAPTNTFEGLCNWLNATECIAFLDHPGQYNSTGREFGHFTTAPSDKIVGMELWNKTDRFNLYYYNDGYFSSDGNLSYYDEALTRGWKIGASGSEDNHVGTWGTLTQSRLAVLASGNNRAEIMNALKARRFFSTYDKNLALSFKIGGSEMGSTITGGSYSIQIRASDANNEVITRIQLLRRGVVINTWTPYSANPEIFDNVTCYDKDYYYIRVKQADGDEAISSPIWVSGGAAANLPPVGAINGPASGSVFTTSANIPIQAYASDPDGNIARVEFYQGATLLGEDVASPYSFTWGNVPAGSYALTCKAIDNMGSSAVSAPTHISVVNTPQADHPNDVTTCRNYTLPPLSNGRYFRSSGGNGLIAAGTVISASQTIFVYAETGTVPNYSVENSFTVTIIEQVTPTFTSVGPLCQNSPAPLLPATSSNGITGTWVPDAVNTFTVGTTVYTFTPQAGQCAKTSVLSITVTELPVVFIVPTSPLCMGTGAITLTGIPSGGIFSGPGVSGESFDPGLIGPGTYTIAYNYTNPAGCSNSTISTIVVNPAPVLRITSPAAACLPPVVDLTAAAVTAGSSSGIVLSYWLDAAASIPLTNPSAAGAGIYYIKATTSAGCFDIKPVTVTVNPSVTEPDPITIAAGSEPVCQLLNGTTTTTYLSSAGNGNIYYSVLPAGAGIMGSATGTMTWAAGFSGVATITASTTGCNGTKTASRIVTIGPSVGIPEFILGPGSDRYSAYETLSYSATAVNSSAISYSLDAASLAGGNTINRATGAVTFSTDWVGKSFITAAAEGCNGPKTAIHTVKVDKTPPIIHWSNQEDVVYETRLSNKQLNATANIPGVFEYIPAIGTLLNAGPGQILTVIFTPANSAKYSVADKTVKIKVKPKPIRIYADAISKIFGSDDPVLTYTCTPALLPEDSFFGTLARAPGKFVGNYAISLGTLTAGPNYSITFISNTFTIKEAPPRQITVTATPGQSKIFGSPDPDYFTYSLSSPLDGDDHFTGDLSREPGEGYGTYPITQGSLSGGKKYEIIFVSNDFTIEPNLASSSFSAEQNYDIRVFPNPLIGPDINFMIALPAGSLVTVDLFARNGQLISRIFDGYFEGGTSKTITYPNTLTEGIYLYQIRTEKQVFNGRIVILMEH